MGVRGKVLGLLVAISWQLGDGAVILADEPTGDVIDLSSLGPGLYGTPDESVGELVKQHNPETSEVNVEELGSYLQGDILFERPAGRNGDARNSSRWPNGVVPYVIEEGFSSKDLQVIQQAMKQYDEQTCVRFVSRTDEEDYVAFQSTSTGCWSSIGRTGGKQRINLQTPGCTTVVGTSMHEMMHAVGFLHEQSREDRDEYVTIHWANIQTGARRNFLKANPNTTNSFGVTYDYGSIMHYSKNAFSWNGRNTISPKFPLGTTKMGQREQFAASDLEKINSMYGCKRSATIHAPFGLGSLPLGTK